MASTRDTRRAIGDLAAELSSRADDLHNEIECARYNLLGKLVPASRHPEIRAGMRSSEAKLEALELAVAALSRAYDRKTKKTTKGTRT